MDACIYEFLYMHAYTHTYTHTYKLVCLMHAPHLWHPIQRPFFLAQKFRVHVDASSPAELCMYVHH